MTLIPSNEEHKCYSQEKRRDQITSKDQKQRSMKMQEACAKNDNHVKSQALHTF